RRATAKRSTNEPGGSPMCRGALWVTKRTRTRALVVQRPRARVELAAQLADFGSLRGDLLAEQAGGEEDAAKDERSLYDGPHRAHALAREGQPGQRACAKE